jgi:hypothetical protein
MPYRALPPPKETRPGYIGAPPMVVRAGYKGAKPVTARGAVRAQTAVRAAQRPPTIVHAATTVGHGTGNDPVRQLQIFLRNRGYAIDVDGIRGPQTSAALAAYHNGISAKAYNSRRTSHPAGPSPAPYRKPSTINRNPPGRTAPVPRGGRAPAPIVAPAAAGIATTDPTANAAAGGDMTAEQIAQAQVDQAYGGNIAAIQRAMAQEIAQGQSNVQQLGQWYGQVGQTNAAAGQSNLQGTQALLGAEGAADANILGLFGGPQANPGAGEAAAYTGINRAELANVGEAQQGFDTAMSPIIQLQGADAAKAAQNTTSQNLAQYAGQLQDMESQKASAYISAVNDAKKSQFDQETQRLQNEAAQQQLDLARQLAGPQIKAANLGNASTAQQIRLRNQQAARDAKTYGISRAQALANIKATNARTAQIKASLTKKPDGTVDLTNPTTRAQLASSLRSSIQTKGGTWRMHPALAQQNMNQALTQLGLSSDSNARAIANSLLAETANNSRSRNMWTAFDFRNGKIVKVPRTPGGIRRANQGKKKK